MKLYIFKLVILSLFTLLLAYMVFIGEAEKLAMTADALIIFLVFVIVVQPKEANNEE